jgi:hypothetical protein
MNIDIEHLNEQQLLDLNRRIVARLNHMRTIRNQVQMLDFEVGERVCFTTKNFHTVTGVITKYNRKTVTIRTDCQHLWNVSPALLRKVVTVVSVTPNTPSAPRIEAKNN